MLSPGSEGGQGIQDSECRPRRLPCNDRQFAPRIPNLESAVPHPASRIPDLLTRRGASLIDLLVALAIFGVVGGMATLILVRSIHATETTVLRSERESQVDATRGVSDLLLASVAPRASDLIRSADTAVVWWATLGRGPICATGLATVSLPASSRNDGVALGAFLSSPQPGDQLEIWSDALDPGPSDDRWTKHTVSAAALSSGACAGSPLVDPVQDVALDAWVLTLSSAPPGTTVGAPTRLLRPTRWALYRSTTDWAQGMSEQMPGGGMSGIQPFAGPFESPSRGGLRIEWLDSLMAVDTIAPTYARIQVVAPVRASLRTPGKQADTTSRLIQLRNRR